MFAIGRLSDVDVEVIGDIKNDTDWTQALDNVDVVVHLAARVHIMREKATNPLDEFRKVNTFGTERLGKMAASSGVKRLIYISSVKVNGEMTENTAFSEDSIPNPRDPYAISKFEAEQKLQSVSSDTGMEFVIIRPPLVYGPGVGGNFLRLMKYIKNGIPLPLGSIKNSRSLIYIGNLVDAIVKCVEHPSAANKTFMVSDGEDLSTPDLIRRLSKALDKPARLILFPQSFLSLVFKLAGKPDDMDRLTDSLVINSAKIRSELNWSPPYSVEQGLKKTAEWYNADEKSV